LSPPNLDSSLVVVVALLIVAESYSPLEQCYYCYHSILD